MYVRCTWSEDKLNIYAHDNMQYRKREVPNLSMFVLKKNSTGIVIGSLKALLRLAN